MCLNYSINKSTEELEERFEAEFVEKVSYPELEQQKRLF